MLSPLSYRALADTASASSLQLRSWRKKRSKTTMPRQARMKPLRVNDAWSMYFVADQLSDGTKIRLLTIIDIHSRASRAIFVGHRWRGEDVVAALNRIVEKRQAPKCLFVDNGSEFSGQLLDLWAYHQQVKIDFSRPGKPTDNCFIETFNGSLRDECLNVHWFASLGPGRRRSLAQGLSFAATSDMKSIVLPTPPNSHLVF